MFLAVGLGPAGYALGLMHLLAHGFFKAGLFLGSGSVIHAMDDEQDMRRYGGLWRVMPITWVTFLLGYLAIIGMPPLSGFFTKDKIIEASFDKGGTSGWTLGVIALLGAGITSFYMSRLFLMTFHGKARWSREGTPDNPAKHPHESPAVMTAPMVVLAIGSAVAGGLMVLGASMQHWLTPSVGRSAEEGAHTISPAVLTALTLVVAAFGFLGALLRYQIRPVETLARPDSEVSVVTVAARHDLFANTANETLFMHPGRYLTRFLVWLDNVGVDGLVRGLAAGVGGLSGRLRRTQTGFVRSYALSMLGGAVLVVGALLLVKAG
jgi:NADH-quinone oxidoreductase subunit L